MTRTRWAFAAIAAAALTTAILYGSWNDGPHRDFWAIAIPGTLTGIGTIGLAAATFAVLRGDQQDRRQREQRELRSEAAHVHSGIPSLIPLTTTRTTYQELEQPRIIWQVEITNRGQYPIRTVQVYLELRAKSLQDAVKKPEQGQEIPVAMFTQLEPEASHTCIFPDAQWTADAQTLLSDKPPRVAVVFSDSNDNRWIREPNWELVEISSSSWFAIHVHKRPLKGPPFVR